MNSSTRTCSTCNLVFIPTSRHKNCVKCRKQAQKSPCPVCTKPMISNSKTCANCRPPSGGDKNPNWKGGKHFHKRGYVVCYVSGHPRHPKYVFEHILVMEDTIGRYLLPGENVHHKNGVRDDNRPENLELWVTNQPSGQRPEDLVVWAKEILSRYEYLDRT